MICCPKCSNEIVKSYPGGKVKLRTNIVIFENGKAICKCVKCHSEVEIPIKLESDSEKVKYYVLEGVNHELNRSKTEKSLPKLQK